MSASNDGAVRPSVPILGWLGAGVWVGVLLAERHSWAVYVGPGNALSPVSLFALAASGCILGLTLRRAVVFALCLGIAVGTACGGLFWADWRADARELGLSTATKWVVESVADPTESRFGAVSEVAVRGGATRAQVVCGWPQDGEVPEAGEYAEIYGTMRAPGRDERARRSHQEGSAARVSARVVLLAGKAGSLRGAIAPVRRQCSAWIAGVPGPGGDLLAGVLLGDRRRLSGTAADDDFRTTGLTHLVAVSGGHLVVVAAVAGLVLRGLRVRPTISAGLVIALLGTYVLLSGVQPSAVRAWLMASVLSGVGMTGRRGDGLGALSAAVVLALAFWPPTAFDLGFRLSVAAVAGLLVFGRLAEQWAVAGLPQALRAVSGPIALTLVAQTVTLPLTAGTFGMVSLVSPLSNLLASPLVSLQLSLGLAGLALSAMSGALGHVVLMAAGAVGAIAVSTAHHLALLPCAAIPLGVNAPVAASACAGLCVVIWAAWPRPSRLFARLAAAACAFGTVAIAVGPPVSGEPAIVLLDVGQGDAVLVRDGGATLLVDTGPSVQALRQALLRNGIRRLDAVLITHLHEDHSGGLGALKGTIPFDVGYVAAGCGQSEVAAELSQGGADVREARAGSRIPVGAWRAEVVWPEARVTDGAENSASVVLLLRRGGFSAVLTGDAEGEILDELTRERSVGDVDVLKVGHHASAGAVTAESLAFLRAEHALISVGAGNRFGHPVPSTLELLSRSGARLHRTDRSGDIKIVVGEHGYRFEFQRLSDRSGGCATLAGAYQPRWEGPHGVGPEQAQSGLPHPQRAGALAGGGAESPQTPSGRACRPGLQPAGLLRGLGKLRRHPERVQHHTVRLRSPPRGRT